jgi:hypothetical protein
VGLRRLYISYASCRSSLYSQLEYNSVLPTSSCAFDSPDHVIQTSRVINRIGYEPRLAIEQIQRSRQDLELLHFAQGSELSILRVRKYSVYDSRKESTPLRARKRFTATIRERN